MDYYGCFHDRYEELVAPLRKQAEELRERERELHDQKKERMLAAQINILDREYEAKIAAGDDEGADSYATEIAKVKAKLQGRADERKQIAVELQEIGNAMSLMGDEVLKELYPTVQSLTIAAWQTALTTTEDVWATLKKFEQEAGAHLSLQIHQQGLIPPSSGRDRATREKISKWLG
jgi:hypothetical protein